MMATIVSFGILLSVVIMHITFALQATEELGNNPQKMQITQQGSFTFSRQSSMTKPGSPFSSLPESNEKNLPSHIPGERDLNFKAVHRSRRGVLSWFASYFQSDSETTEEPTKLDQTTSDIKDQEQSLAQTETTTLSEFTGNSEKEPVKPAQNRLHNPIDKPSGNDVEQQGTTREPRSTESIPVTDFLKKVNPQMWLTTVSAFLHKDVDVKEINVSSSDVSSVPRYHSQSSGYDEPTDTTEKTRTEKRHRVRHHKHHADKVQSELHHGADGGRDRHTRGSARSRERDPKDGKRSRDGKSKPCATCGVNGGPGYETEPGSMSEAEVKVIRTSMIAELLRKKLRLDARDLENYNKNGSVDRMRLPMLPRAVLDETRERNSLLQEEDDFFARDEEAIVAGEDMGRNCIGMRSTGCYNFKFNGKVKGEVASADLWLYKTHDRRDVSEQTFIVYELERPRGSRTVRRRNLVAREGTFTREGWVTLDMTRPVQRWLEKRRGGEMLAIRCKTCDTHNYRAIFGTKHGYKPLLIVKYVDKYSARVKRSEDNCNPATECCKRPLVINFNNINLPTILQPANLAMGYCYGHCDGVDRYTYNHTSIRQRLRWTDGTGISEQTRAQLTPCCVPLQLKDTSILTVENSIIVRKVLPKVKVERCGCI